jgi:hypothetical protein
MKKMRKPALIILTLVLMSLLLSCSGMEIQFQPKAMKVSPKKILIGAFENRMPDYNPVIIKNFRDALKFEFLKLGYDAQLLATDESKNADSFACADRKVESSDAKEPQKNKVIPITASKEAIQLCCEKYTSDMFIRGTISILETGDLTDSKASTFISVLMYNKSGEQIGEAHYSGSGQMSDAKSIKAIANKFARQINSELRKLHK